MTPDRLERLLVLIATISQFPGIGCPPTDETPTTQSSAGHHSALAAVQAQVQQLAQSLCLSWPSGYPAIATLRKDLEILRRYGVLERRMYRWGYYLGTGAMTKPELAIALTALASQARYQGDPMAKRIYAQLQQRLKGMDLDQQGQLFYPVRQQVDLPIMATDPLEMIAQGKRRDNLFHCIDAVELAIVRGQVLELVRLRDPYGAGGVGSLRVIPLQLMYSNIAWYLLYENFPSGHLAVSRVDRLGSTLLVREPIGRGIELQKKQLIKAQGLLQAGWGLFLGNEAEQAQELAGTLPSVLVRVRFFPPVIPFILEGENRHCSQVIRRGPKNHLGQLTYVDYQVSLPSRSLPEFLLFINRFMESAQILEPQQLGDDHYRKAQNLVNIYQAADRGNVTQRGNH